MEMHSIFCTKEILAAVIATAEAAKSLKNVNISTRLEWRYEPEILEVAEREYEEVGRDWEYHLVFIPTNDIFRLDEKRNGRQKSCVFFTLEELQELQNQSKEG